jgi:hypothetical protein
VVPAGKITDQSEVKQFSDHMDLQGPEDFFLKLSLNESLIPDTWKRIRSFYFGQKEIPDPDDLIKVRQEYVAGMFNSTGRIWVHNSRVLSGRMLRDEELCKFYSSLIII